MLKSTAAGATLAAAQGEFGNSEGNGNDQTQETPALTATWQEKCRYICKDANVFSRGTCYVVCSFLLVDDVNGIGRDFITPTPATDAAEAAGCDACSGCYVNDPDTSTLDTCEPLELTNCDSLSGNDKLDCEQEGEELTDYYRTHCIARRDDYAKNNNDDFDAAALAYEWCGPEE